jgi:plastocyanin
MTDTTTTTADTDGEEAPAGTGPDVPADDHLAISDSIGTGAHKPVKDRLVLPLLVPILSAVAVGMLAVNISRVFLAGSSEAALIAAIVITLAILGGASLLAAAPRMHTSSLAVITGLIVVIIVSGGLLTLGPSLGHDGEGGGGYVEPTGPAVATLDVEAISTPLSFNEKDYTVPAGIVEVKLGGDDGHTLAFREPEFSGFLLGPTPNPPLEGKVELEPGDYRIYCTIPGHAAAGMEATVTVGGA